MHYLYHRLPPSLVPRIMPELAREEVDVTSTLRNILDNYPPGSATLREILQNTDDAGGKQQVLVSGFDTTSSSLLIDER